MSSSSLPNGSSAAAKRAPLIRLFDWLLDHDGDIYGDERDRQSWYEAIAASASLQWIAIPWTLAIVVWFVPTDAIWALAVIFALQLALIVIVLPYLGNRRVDYARPQRSAKARIIQVISTLPLFVFVLGATVGADIRNGTDSSIISAGLIGGAFGAAVGGAVGYALLRRKRNRAAAAEVEPEDD
jgi:hypothetical protein